MYYTNSKWKRFKNGLTNSHMKLYVIVLIVLAVVIGVTIKKSGLIAGMMQAEHPQASPQVEEERETGSTEPISLVSVVNSYEVLVNKSANFITVNQLNSSGEVVETSKTFRCSVNSTVQEGEYSILEKNIWRNLGGAGYGQYTSRIGNDCYIHSVPYYSQNANALNVNAYNLLGSEANVGYIYLASADAKWIYENCSIGSVVRVYSDASEKPSVELDELVSISGNGRYDPTDTSANIQPIETKIKYMTGVENHSVPLGSAYNVWDGVYAVDTDGNDITDKITVTGTVNTTVRGTYTIVYHLRDNYGTDLGYYSYVTVY
jgi:hypothetical protein